MQGESPVQNITIAYDLDDDGLDEETLDRIKQYETENMASKHKKKSSVHEDEDVDEDEDEDEENGRDKVNEYEKVEHQMKDNQTIYNVHYDNRSMEEKFQEQRIERYKWMKLSPAEADKKLRDEAEQEKKRLKRENRVLQEKKKRLLINDDDWNALKSSSYVTEIPFNWKACSGRFTYDCDEQEIYPFLEWCDEQKCHVSTDYHGFKVRLFIWFKTKLAIGPGMLVYFKNVFYLCQPCIFTSIAGGERKAMPNALPTVAYTWYEYWRPMGPGASFSNFLQDWKVEQPKEDQVVEKVKKGAEEKVFQTPAPAPLSPKNKVSPVASPAPSKGKKGKQKKWTQILSDIDQTTKGSDLFHEVSTYLADNPVQRPDKNWAKVVTAAKSKLTAEEFKKFSNLRSGKSK